MSQSKPALRKQLRETRRAHVESLPDAMRGLLFRHPPAPLLERIAPGQVIGLYRANEWEAPAVHYAGFFQERGHDIALPRFASRDAPMHFARHADPYGETDLEDGPLSIPQPAESADTLVPDVLFVPLIGFTERGDRLGQGGGHYDRWLAEHPGTPAIGLAWDVQLCEEMGIEAHDQPLDAVVTPTRFYGPF